MTVKKNTGMGALLRGVAFAICLPASLAACGDDGGGDGSNNADADVADASEDEGLCGTYCDQMESNCSGDNQQYRNRADCIDYCTSVGWDEGEEGDTTGNSLQCRIYHGGDPATAEPAEHCPHAGSTGGGVCGATVTFRNDPGAEFTRVDRMGMPAVSTALISSAMKNAYNDADPSDDASGSFVPTLAESLTGIHNALDDDLTALSLSPCSMVDQVNSLPECFGQEIAPGVTVASLVLPDTLHINPAQASGFPNGRRLVDPVIDVTLGVILLKMGATCGSGTCSPTTLVDPPLNPPANDLSFPDNFPYLAAPHQP